MPRLQRPDGVEIDWEERGEGPLAVIAHPFFGYPEMLQDLIDDLARDHRVVTYHLRGTGKSSREGPYDIATDAADLTALLGQLGEPAILIPMGDGVPRSVKAAAWCSVPVTVVSPGGNPVGTEAVQGTDGLAASESVVGALVAMMEADYRTGLHTMINTANPQFDDQRLRERVDRTAEHCPRDAALPRLRAWIDDSSIEEARALGDRLWLLDHGNNPWFPIEALKRTRELLPEAHLEKVEDGPISRPDITTSVVRSITSGQARGAAPESATPRVA